jgi:hypothetical protein
MHDTARPDRSSPDDTGPDETDSTEASDRMLDGAREGGGDAAGRLSDRCRGLGGIFVAGSSSPVCAPILVSVAGRAAPESERSSAH